MQHYFFLKMKSILLALLFLTVPISKINAQSIEWLSLEQVQAAIKQNPKPILFDVYTDWCGWCKVMDKKTFGHPAIAEYVNQNFYAVKLDGEDKDTLIFQGKAYPFVAQGRRGYNLLAATLLQGRLSYPTLLIMSAQFEILSVAPGYLPPKDFEPFITFFGAGEHKLQTFEQYKKNYQRQLVQE
jgi:thioredoxin-related protein